MIFFLGIVHATPRNTEQTFWDDREIERSLSHPLPFPFHSKPQPSCPSGTRCCSMPADALVQLFYANGVYAPE